MQDLKKIEIITSKGKFKFLDSLVLLFIATLVLVAVLVILNRHGAASRVLELLYYLLGIIVVSYLWQFKSSEK